MPPVQLDSRRPNLAFAVVLYYDYILTIISEITLYWLHPFTWTSFFFFLTRYSSIILYVPIALEFFAPRLTYQVMKVLLYSHQTHTLTRLFPNSSKISSCKSCEAGHNLPHRCRSLIFVHQVYCIYAVCLIAGRSS